MNYAGFWIRVAAAIIDSIIFALVLAPVLILIYGFEYYAAPSTSLARDPLDFLISYAAPAAATIAFWVTLAGTPGKLVLGLEVLDAQTGEKIGVGKGVLRYIGYFAAIIPIFIGLIWVAFDAKKQGWHDKIAGTVVVNKS
ncbi:MAG: RDD family protein [Pseudomonadota bacterium]